MRELTEEQRAELWNAIIAKVDELPRGHGSSRSPVWRSANGGRVMSVLSLGREDGANDVYLIEAGYDHRKEVSVEVTGPMIDSLDRFWTPRIEEHATNPRIVIIENRYYSIGDPNMKGERGFAGRRFKIRRFDPADPKITEAVVETTNLWFGGIVPPKFREALPDNGEFLT